MRAMLALILPLAATSAAGAAALDRTVNVSRDHSIEVRYGREAPEEGSGNRIRQARSADDFTSVIVDDALDAEITIGPRFAVELEGDDNLIGRIRAETTDGVLHLQVEGGYRVRQSMVARITLPSLAGVDLRTSGNARIGGLQGGRLALATSGSGSFRADGRVDEVAVRIQGSGDAELGSLRARNARVVINGSGDVRAFASDALIATVNGTGNVTYAGNPRQVSEDVNGTGSISPATY